MSDVTFSENVTSDIQKVTKKRTIAD